MGIPADLVREFRFLVPAIPLRDVAVFTGNLATCLQAGLKVPDSVETCTRSSPNAMLRASGPRLAAKIRDGNSLSEALGELKPSLPRFYLPVLRCGERSGRIDQALHYLQEHCALLEKPYEAMRNLWLVPLALYLVASAVLIVAHFLLAPLLAAIHFLLQRLVRLALLAAVVLLVLNVEPLRCLWDRLVLALPIVGRSARELAVNRFLHAFNLMYQTGGMAVVPMLRTACATVGNSVVRDELLAAMPHLQRGGTLAESLAQCPSLTEDQKAVVAAGEEAGRLEDALATLCRQTSELLQIRLRALQAVYFRLIAAFVIFGTLLTLQGLLTLSHLH
ncbi:MAG: type II secretion system F family protein [Thermoguttaceae bacterium]